MIFCSEDCIPNHMEWFDQSNPYANAEHMKRNVIYIGLQGFGDCPYKESFVDAQPVHHTFYRS